MDSIQQNIVDSYNKNAMERDSYSFQDWKVKEREIFLETLKTKNAVIFWRLVLDQEGQSLF